MPRTIEHKCPCCGGSLSFDSGSQNIVCPYCDSQFDPEDLKAADEALQGDIDEKIEWEADAGMKWEEGEEAGFSLYKCQSCGGEIIADDNTAATSCPYCSSPVILNGRLAGSLKPNIVIPFSIDRQGAADALDGFFKGKILLPRDYKKLNKVEEVKGLYVPYWIYDADVTGRVCWNATTVRRWSSGDYNYKETRYHSIIRSGKAGFDHIPVDGSSKMPDDLMESIEPFHWSSTKQFQSAYLSGYYADKYDVPQKDTLPRATERVKQGTIDAFGSTITNHYNTLTLNNAKLQLEKTASQYALFPVWTLSSVYKGKHYFFAVNGDTGKIAGNLPYSKLKAFLLGVLTFIPLLAIFVLLGLFFSTGAEEAEDSLGVMIVFSIIGLLVASGLTSIVSRKLIKQCKNVEFSKSARVYYRDGSMSLNDSRDIYLYKRVTRTRRSSSSSSHHHHSGHRRR